MNTEGTLDKTAVAESEMKEEAREASAIKKAKEQEEAVAKKARKMKKVKKAGEPKKKLPKKSAKTKKVETKKGRKVTKRGEAKTKDGGPRPLNGTMCISLPPATFVKLEKERTRAGKARKLDGPLSRSKAIDEALQLWFKGVG